MNDFDPHQYGKLEQKVDDLVDCCKEVRTEIDAAKTRSVATLTTVIVLLIGTVANLALYYVQHQR